MQNLPFCRKNTTNVTAGECKKERENRRKAMKLNAVLKLVHHSAPDGTASVKIKFKSKSFIIKMLPLVIFLKEVMASIIGQVKDLIYSKHLFF